MKIATRKSLKYVLLYLLFTVSLSLVCSKNPPLDPTANTGEQFKLFVGLQANPTTVAPGGNSIIRALILDQSNQPVAGDTVRFSTTIGSLSATTQTTNDSGFAIVLFTAPQRRGEALISGQYGANKMSVTIDVRDTTPGTITIEAEETSLLADGISSTIVSTEWRSKAGDPITGLPITFETNVGLITPAAVTDSSGMAHVTFTSQGLRTDAIAQIDARSDSTEAMTQILLRGVDFQIDANPQNIIADGRSESTVKIILKETTNTIAISGAQIQLGADLGTIPNSVITDASGVATANLTSSAQTGSSTVTAIYGNALTDTVHVMFGESVPTYLTVSANPVSIPADNQSTSTLIASVTDGQNNPVSDGTVVNFQIIDGTGTIESQKMTTGGIARSVLTSGTKPDTALVVVKVDQLTDTTSVRFVVGDATAMTLVADSTSLPADGITSTRIVARVFDAAGNTVVDGTRVSFSTDIGDVTESAQTVAGQAEAQFSSSQTGVATIQATAGGVSEHLNIQLRPGPPNSILLNFDPNSLGVKDSGRNQTVTVTATVVDSKNNPVLDGTLVRFSIFASPGGGEFLSSTEAIPTVNGNAQVSLNSGIRSGSVRIMAQVTDAAGVPVVPEVRAISTEILIFAGPPFIENVNNALTSHLTVGVGPSNIVGWDVVNNTARVTVVVGDKFNNPVPAGTAVFFTTTAGVISTHTGFTDEEGIATVTIHSGNPLPDITRFYNTFFDPNENHPDWALGTNVIPGPIPDYDLGEVVNSLGGVGENDGIVRIIATTEGVDANGKSARPWSVANLVFSGGISTFTVTADTTELAPGESALISFTIYDVNGNPIVGGSEITVSSNGGALSWTSLITADPGQTHYNVTVTNNIDPSDPSARTFSTPVTIDVKSENGNIVQSSPVINFNLN